MSDSSLLIHTEDGVCHLTLNRPQAKNALTTELAKQLVSALEQVRSRTDIRAVLLSGAGGNFCSGADVKNLSGGQTRTLDDKRASLQTFQAVVRALQGLPCPMVIAVQGVAYGAGLSLVAQGDLIVTAQNARLCAVFHRLGLVPDLGLWHSLPRVVGLQRARELIFSAREFSGAEAQQFGLALEALPENEVLSRAQQLAQALAQGPGLASTLSRQALNLALQSDLDTILALETAAQGQLSGTEYFQMAVQRLSQREAPLLNWPTPPFSS